MDEGPDQGAPAEEQGTALDPGDQVYRWTFDRAVRLLAQREHSLRELREKLARKGADEAIAARVVEDLRERGLQSDERFAESFVHSRLNRGHGPIRIRQELSQRGIPDELADALLTRSRECWLALAAEARGRKFGGEAPVERNAWNRQARFLARRGFPSDLIYRVLGDATE